MPRIYASDNDPFDFCKRHFPNPQNALAKYAKRGDGPDGRGNCFAYDAEHPDYGGEGYTCTACGCTLTDRDN